MAKTGAAGGAAAGAGMALTGAAAGGLTEAGKDVLTLLSLITLFTWILSKAAEKMKDRRKDKPDHDDDDSEITLSITSMSFQHSPDDFTASAVRCRTCDGSVSPAGVDQCQERWGRSRLHRRQDTERKSKGEIHHYG